MSRLAARTTTAMSSTRTAHRPAHWLFKSNLPPRRTSSLGRRESKRHFFGMSEIMGVIANPSETVRSLTESKRLLEEARREISESRERAQLRPAHTFSPLPGFFPRPAETRAIELVLEGDPSFTVLFGASSVGKTALLREVLSRPDYHVLHFDLRIAGFADLSSLYMSLSQQMEQYFEAVAISMPGYEPFEKEAWGFKHDRLNVERRISSAQGELASSVGSVKTSDIARLMELFQSSLLKYWQFQPEPRPKEDSVRPSTDSDTTRVEDAQTTLHGRQPEDVRLRRRGTWSGRLFSRSRLDLNAQEERAAEQTPEDEEPPPKKKVPVVFFDEAHKLPALIRSTEAMKCILDSMLVITKQDRLCHVIHATSDPFYQTWLRQLNVMQHCKIVTIGDCSKAETKSFFEERLLPRVPEHLQSGLDFQGLYEAFGGKLAHWADYVTDYVNAEGRLEIERSSHFVQAHALLNLHLLHAAEAGTLPAPAAASQSTVKPFESDSGLGAASTAGFRIYSPLHAPDMESSGGDAPPGFDARQLLRAMGRLAHDEDALSYFALGREMGVRAVDAMVRGRVLELRWTETVTREGAERGAEEEEEEEWVPGPRLVPTTPIMRYAMREVVREYEEEGTMSDYVSVISGDVDEY